MKCDIIRDLLPAYCDGLCSEETSREIEAHTAECTECADMIRSMKADIDVPAVTGEISADKAFKKINLKMQNKAITIAGNLICILLLVILLFICITGYKNRYEWEKYEESLVNPDADRVFNMLISGDIDNFMNELIIQQDILRIPSEEEITIRRETINELYEYWKTIGITEVSSLGTEYSFIFPNYDYYLPTTTYVLCFHDFANSYVSLSKYRGKYIINILCESTESIAFPEKYAEYEQLINKVDYLINPCLDNVPFTEFFDPTSNLKPNLISRHCSDNPYAPDDEFSEALCSRLTEFSESDIICENINFTELKFDSDIKLYTKRMTMTFLDPKTEKHITYSRIIPITDCIGFAVIPEYPPEITDEGVSEECRRIVTELWG
ncbi:MAG: zf-HC2 domain-containing protein [Oscillospiraceae bacterium]|nr:zf-HC2 domain-containing protein [Oscillospiraceae bacterium]